MLPTVRTYMDSETHALEPDDDIRVALGVLIDSGVTGAPVVNLQGELVGMISELECLRLLARGTSEGMPVDGARVADFMVDHFERVTPDTDVYYVAGLFLRDPSVRRFPVVEGRRLVGVITRKDILRAVAART